MNIIEINDSTNDRLTAFKKREYPTVDKEHYGEYLPDFTTREFTLIAQEGDDVAGYIDITIRLGVAYISSLLVGEKYRGTGIGKQLLLEAETKAKSLGAHKIWLETSERWSAKAFYEKLGYTIRTILPNDAGKQTCVLMDKML